MSDNETTTTATSPADMPATTAEVAEPTQDDPHDLERARQLRAENKTLRGRAKSAEAQLEGLAERIEGFQREAITRAAGDILKSADDIFTGGAAVVDFLDEDGNVDLDAVRDAAGELVTERPHWGTGYVGDKPPTQRPVEGLRPGALPRDYTPPQQTWRDVLRYPSER